MPTIVCTAMARHCRGYRDIRDNQDYRDYCSATQQIASKRYMLYHLTRTHHKILCFCH